MRSECAVPTAACAAAVVQSAAMGQQEAHAARLGDRVQISHVHRTNDAGDD